MRSASTNSHEEVVTQQHRKPDLRCREVATEVGPQEVLNLRTSATICLGLYQCSQLGFTSGSCDISIAAMPHQEVDRASGYCHVQLLLSASVAVWGHLYIPRRAPQPPWRMDGS
eukprot:2465445-Amphidinium_carterae.2